MKRLISVWFLNTYKAFECKVDANPAHQEDLIKTEIRFTSLQLRSMYAPLPYVCKPGHKYGTDGRVHLGRDKVNRLVIWWHLAARYKFLSCPKI